jgi:hypothetical protein
VLTTLHLRREGQVKALLGIPDHVDTYALIPLGFPAGRFGPLRRSPIEEVVHPGQVGRTLTPDRGSREDQRHSVAGTTCS